MELTTRSAILTLGYGEVTRLGKPLCIRDVLFLPWSSLTSLDAPTTQALNLIKYGRSRCCSRLQTWGKVSGYSSVWCLVEQQLPLEI